MLTDELGAEVIYTRRDDRFVPLEERTRIANESRADLFLSIHANSSPIKSVSGIETFILSFTTQKDALETAARENASSDLGVFELRDLLQKIALKEKVNESRQYGALAGLVQPSGERPESGCQAGAVCGVDWCEHAECAGRDRLSEQRTR
jgi:N-acetylmuramoyl-L-alanine amidase